METKSRTRAKSRDTTPIALVPGGDGAVTDGVRRVGAVTALVVFCHPKPDEPALGLLEATIGGLSDAGHTVEVIDLYRDGFDAALSIDEWHTYTTPPVPPGEPRYAEMIGRAEILAFVFPMWWSGPPSMLKGFFDRVLAPGVAFDLAETGRVRAGLRHLRRVVVVTAAEAPGNFPHRSTRPLAYAFGRSLRRATGWKTRTITLWAGPSDARDADDWTKFLARTRRRLSGLR